MTNRTFLAARAAAIFSLTVALHPVPSFAQEIGSLVQPPMARVRSNHPGLAAIMAEAARRSATFRRLVDTIDASDGLVYVDEGTCGHGVKACLTLGVQVAGPHRLLRILIDPRRKRSGCELMASIGHELKHAIEVLGEPGVRDFDAAYAFFERESPADRTKGRFETQAAVRTGLQVDREACSG